MPEYNTVFRTTAVEEEAAAVLFYTRIDPGPGDRFVAAPESILQRIARAPQYFGFLDARKQLRDGVVPGFPFIVVFSIEENAVVVLSNRHTARRPYASD